MRQDLIDIHDRGMEFASYRDRLKVHADRFDLVYRQLDGVTRDERGNGPLGSSRILVLTEDFCIDSVLNVPLIARLQETSPAARVRFASRDAHQTIAREFPGRDGRSRVPTVIFLTERGFLQGYWSERSAPDHAWMADFLATDPIPPITLQDGYPAKVLAEWMTRRFEAQLPFFLDESWRSARDELAAIAAEALT